MRIAPLALFLLAAIQALPARATGLKALTLNVAAIPVLHARLRERLTAVAEAIRDDDYDVVALQEAPAAAGLAEFGQRAGLPHQAVFGSGPIPGVGLAVMSKYPIEETKTLTFTCRPSLWKLYAGESLANRGALMARVQTPRGAIDVYDTHLIADSGKARYVTLRLTQIFELSQMIARESATRPFLVLGDLNMSPDAPAYRVLVDLLGLQDACVKRGEDECGITNEEDGERLDHALLPDGARDAASAEAAFTEPIPGTNFPYSDHEGVAATLSPGAFRLRLDPDPQRRLEALMRVEASIDAMMEALKRERARAVWVPIYGFAALLRYDRQLSQLASIRDRVETERIVWASGRRPRPSHG